MGKTAYLGSTFRPTHSHENARFVLVLEGTFTESYERKHRHCQPYTLIYRPPQETHAENFHPGGAICFSVDLERWWLERLRAHSIEFDASADFRSPTLTSLMIRLDHEFKLKDAASGLALEALLLEMAVEAFRLKVTGTEKKSPCWLERAKEFIHAHYSDNLTLTSISQIAGVHPVHLARTFRQHYGCSVAEYIRNLRLEAACSALSATDAPLAEIAAAGGFYDQSHFSNTFKQLTGMTPAEYRFTARAR